MRPRLTILVLLTVITISAVIASENERSISEQEAKDVYSAFKEVCQSLFYSLNVSEPYDLSKVSVVVRRIGDNINVSILGQTLQLTNLTWGKTVEWKIPVTRECVDYPPVSWSVIKLLLDQCDNTEITKRFQDVMNTNSMLRKTLADVDVSNEEALKEVILNYAETCEEKVSTQRAEHEEEVKDLSTEVRELKVDKAKLTGRLYIAIGVSVLLLLILVAVKVLEAWDK